MFMKNARNIIENHIIDTLSDSLPHGSGINGKWICNVSFKTQKIYASNTFYRMNEVGMYTHFVDFTAIFDFDYQLIKVQMENCPQWLREGLKGYLEDTISNYVNEELVW